MGIEHILECVATRKDVLYKLSEYCWMYNTVCFWLYIRMLKVFMLKICVSSPHQENQAMSVGYRKDVSFASLIITFLWTILLCELENVHHTATFFCMAKLIFYIVGKNLFFFFFLSWKIVQSKNIFNCELAVYKNIYLLNF